MNPAGRSTYHPARDATSGSTSASTSRKVVWKGGITIRDENDELKTLQGLVFQAQDSLPLHLSFYPPTPTTSSHPSNQITPPVGSLDLEQAIFPSTPSAVATSSKVTLDTPFGGATVPEGSGNHVIDGILKCRQTKAFRLSHRTVEVPKLYGLRSKQEDLVDGVRVITSQSSTEAIRHIQSLLVPPKLKQPQALDSSGRTLRGIVLAAPVPDDHDPLVESPPLLLLYGIKHTFPNDLKNKPRLLLFVTLYQPNPPKGSVLPARKRASLAMKPPLAIPRTTADDDDEERDPLPEPVRKRFKDRTGMGRGALLHHLPPPPPPPAPAPVAKRKVAASTGKGKEREGSLVAAVVDAAEAGGAGKRRRVELDGEVGVQRVESSRAVEIVQEKVELSIEQMNRNILRSEVSLALLTRGVPSDHHELKTLGQWITRGAGFSLRETLTSQLLKVEDMSEAIESHLESYLPKEFKTSKPPRVESVEAGSQTEERVAVEMSTQTVEVEAAVEPKVVTEEPAVEEDASPMEEDESPVAVEIEVAEEQPSALEVELEELNVVVELQEEVIEEPPVEQQEETDATCVSISNLPASITPSELPEVEMAAPLPPTQPSPRRTRVRPSSVVSPLKSAPATTSTQAEPLPSPSAVLAIRQDSDLTPTPSETEEEAVEEESETPTKTRSGRARVSNRERKVALSSPLKQSQVAKEPELAKALVETVAEVEPEVVAPMEDEQVVEEEIEQPEEVVVYIVEELEVEEPSQPEPTPIELAPLPPPPAAPRRTSSRRASAVGLPTPTEPILPALPSTIVEQLPTIAPSPPAATAAAPSEPTLPPPSSLPSPSSSQTPTKLPFRRTRSNRSALSSNHDASSPVTPQASTSLFAVEVEVVTPTASTSTSNKRTRGGSRKLQAGQPEKEQEKEKEEEEEVNKTPRATRSRRGSVMPSESVVVEEAKVVKSKGKGKKVVKKGKAVEAEVEVEVEAEAVEQEQEQEMEGVVEELVVAVAEPVALEDELEEGEIREDDVPEAIVVEQEEAPVVVEQEEMQVEVEPVVAAPQPPPSPARVALSESPSALRANLDTPITTSAAPLPSPRLTNDLDKENDLPVEDASASPSTLPPSLPKVADLPASPPTSSKAFPPPPTTQTPSVATESEAATPSTALLPISSSSSSLPPRPTPTSKSKSDFNSRLSSAGLPSKPAPQPIQVHRAAVVSPLPQPIVALEEVSKLVAVSLADAGKKKKRSLPPLPSEYEDVDRKWKAGVIPSVKTSSSKPVVEEEVVVTSVQASSPTPTVAAAARRASLVEEVSPSVLSPAVPAPVAVSARPTAPPPAPKPVVALASLLAAYSSDDESEEDEPAPCTNTSVSPIIEVVASQQPSETVVVAPPPKLVVDDFFVADEDPKTGSVERDPTMYYTDEDSDMRMEDGVGGVRIVKKGWF